MIAVALKTALGLKKGCQYETRRNPLGMLVILTGESEPNLVAYERQLEGYVTLVPRNTIT